MTYVPRTLDFSIIVPKEATNLCVNPSFEIDVSGYTIYNGTFAKVTTDSRRGVACGAITPQANQAVTLEKTLALTATKVYSLSLDCKGVAGQTYYLQVTDGTQSVTGTSWTGTGYWCRRYLTFTAANSATYAFYLIRSSINSTAVYYTDGWQIEEGAVSTYFDGSSQGLVFGETGAYRWNGAWGASTSWRSGQTRSGGTYLHLSTYGKILAILGLGMGPISNVGLSSNLGGATYQNTIKNERPFSIVMNINGEGDLSAIQKARAALENAVNPDLVTKKQPIVLQCDETDANGLEAAETTQIACTYEGGLQGAGDGNAWNEKISLDFKMWMPIIRQQGERGAVLGYQTAVANANYILKRAATGTWSALGTGTGGQIYAMSNASDGSIFVGGGFTNLGDANGDYISKWNGSAWSSLGAGMNNEVYAIALGPDGSIYVGGSFHLAGGVANTVHVAKWDGSVWTPLSTGTGAEVYALAFGKDGSLYVGGGFTNLGDANGDYIAKWNGSAWSSLGTGTNGTVTSIAVAADGSIYVGGNFTLAGGVTNTAHIAQWNGSAWLPLGTGANDNVEALQIGGDNNLYVGGLFTLAGGVANTLHIAQWNGVAWSPLSTGTSSYVYSLCAGKNGEIYIGGDFATAGGITTPASIVTWMGSIFAPIDVSTPAGATFRSLLVNKNNGDLYIGYSSNGTAYSATVTVPSVGSAPAYPTFFLNGPGTIYQIKNYTTGKSIFFNLTLQAGEQATLDLDPQHPFFISSWRGDLWNTILPGSNTNWELLPGTNNVSAFMYGSTSAATQIVMTWRDGYLSLDGAVR
jgi:hypothetical protein